MALSVPPRRGDQRPGHRGHQPREWNRQRSSAGDEAEAKALRRELGTLPPVRLPEASPRPVPHHAPPEPATRDEARGARAGLPHPQEDEGWALDTRPAVKQPVELCPRPEPLRPRQPRARGRRLGHAASPSAGADPWRAGASAPSGRLSWPCADGTRASWPAGAGSVGTSASPRPPRGCYAHSPPILQTAPRARQAPGRPARTPDPVAAPKITVLWWAARSGPETRRRFHAARAAAPRPAQAMECGTRRR
jgi:hypothetical protein